MPANTPFGKPCTHSADLDKCPSHKDLRQSNGPLPQAAEPCFGQHGTGDSGVVTGSAGPPSLSSALRA